MLNIQLVDIHIFNVPICFTLSLLPFMFIYTATWSIDSIMLMFYLHGNLIVRFNHQVNDNTSILQFQNLIFLLCTQCRKAYQARYLVVGFFRIFHLFNHDSDHPLIISIATRTNCKSPSTSWKLKSSAFLIAETTTSPFELDAAKAIRDFLDASIAKFTSCACKNIFSVRNQRWTL